MMFMRMYMMLTFFSTAFLYINLAIVKDDFKVTKKKQFALIGISVLGFLTQYFFFFFSALIFIIMITLFIKHKEYKEMKKYIRSIVIAGIVGLLLFPFSVDHMLRSDRRVGSFESENYFGRVLTYFNMILQYFGSMWDKMIALFAIALIAILLKKSEDRKLMAIIILPTIIYIMIVAKLAEFIDLRYVMNILPIVAMMIIIAVGSIFENQKYNYIIAAITLVILVGYGLVTEEPLYLYKGYNKYIEISEKYKEDDFVYVGYAFFNHLQSMPEFMNYKKTLMLYEDQLDALINNEELSDKSEFILSVNESMEPEETLNKVLNNTGFTNYELIYEGCEEIEQVIYRVYR